MRARYSIGIDLGTTNTALAYASLERGAESQMLPIPQFESATAIVESAGLPSFLYLPDGAPPRSGLDERAADERWVVGRLARIKAAETPGRVVHSAKSWLAHHSADRSAPFLPWGSDDIERDDKLSPVRAAALVLRYLREAWNERFAAAGEAFEEQVVTITVPASFDAVAQRLTLDAAAEARYPQTVRLLEEPQAALYRWLEDDDSEARPAMLSAGADGRARHVLVVDIGGGTSDFSVFSFHPHPTGGEPRIERIAVSEHILLGGDNMDLALAHRLEPGLSEDGENLSGRQWEYLVARSRDIKETAFSTDGSPGDVFSVSIPGRGSRLIAQAKSAQISRTEIERLLFDGFFPECAADEYPIRAKTALRELGLPYARDPAITRHLADFLRERPPVDAVLFNGGALHPRRLRERIRAELEKWQPGTTVIGLENAEPDLAVARGAAFFGKLVHSRAQRIEAGAAHAIFLQAHRADDRGQHHDLVCVLPHGAATEETFGLRDVPLELRVNRQVRFQTYSSARHSADAAGDIVAWNDRDFQALPPLETLITAADAPHDTLPVRLSARVSELGRLEIACVSEDPNVPGSWPLEFNLRSSANGAPSPGFSTSHSSDARGDDGPNVGAKELAAARERISSQFERPINPRDRLTATRLLKSLEQILGAPRSSWNVILVRSLWSTLQRCMDDRGTSIDHEEAWLILAGFLLRPGFGAALDETRIDRLWTLRESGVFFAAKTVKIQEYVLWRRVAGGLSRERQEDVLSADYAKLFDGKNPPPELVLLAGSLERIATEMKSELIDRFIDVAATFEREKKHNAHYLAALGFLLNRAPLYGGPEIVVSADLVDRAFDAFSRFDWDGPTHLELQTMFLRAARVVDNRNIDAPRALRRRIAEKLERAGVPAARTAPLKEYMPMARAERAGSFGDSLPPGLILRSGTR